MSRPTVYSTKMSEIINFRLTPERRLWLQQLAVQNQITLSAQILSILDYYQSRYLTKKKGGVKNDSH